MIVDAIQINIIAIIVVDNFASKMESRIASISIPIFRPLYTIR